MIQKFYNLLYGMGIKSGHDKVLHFTVMFTVLTFCVPIAIWLSSFDAFIYFRYLLWILFDVSPSDRDFAQLSLLMLAQIAIFYKEHRDGWVKGWFFDVFAGEIGMIAGFIMGGGVIARLMGM